MSARPNNLILNGFDRCGSTAIARTLARHPEIEVIMQPFNSGSIRSKLYHLMNDELATPADIRFFKMLEAGQLDTSYIQSDWHRKHSTVGAFEPGKLHVLKTTLNHFSAAWVNERFPGIEQWGIWRDPMEMLASLIRNGFHEKWYNDSMPQLAQTVRQSELLRPVFAEFLDSLDNHVRLTGFVLAVRTFFYFSHISGMNVLQYERFVDNPNHCFAYLMEHFELAPFDFGCHSDCDLNVVGKVYEAGADHRDILPRVDRAFLSAVFSPLDEVAPVEMTGYEGRP